MRRLSYTVCTLLSLGLLLGPVSTLHAHVSDSPHEHEHEQVRVHGGHTDDLAADHRHDPVPADTHDQHASDHVIDLQLDSLQGGSSQPWTKWLVLMAAVALVIFAAHPKRLRHTTAKSTTLA